MIGYALDPQKTGQNAARAHDLLLRDDAKQWNQAFFGQREALNRWVMDNAVHAVEHCPNVMAMWKDSQQRDPYAPETLEARLVQAVARGLENMDVAAKIGLLENRSYGPAQTQLQQYLKRTGHWSVCSPSWLGPQESALRQAARKAGWSPIHLPGQVANAIERAESFRWAPHIRYPHSLAMLHWMHLAQRPNFKPRTTPLIKTSQVWAKSQDVELSHFLMEHGGRRPNCMWTAHEAVPRLSTEEKQTLYTLVKMHKDLDLWNELREGIARGDLPSLAVPEMLELPEFEM